MAKQTTTLSAFAPGAAAAAAAAAAGGPVGTGSAVGGGAGASLQPYVLFRLHLGLPAGSFVGGGFAGPRLAAPFPERHSAGGGCGLAHTCCWRWRSRGSSGTVCVLGVGWLTVAPPLSCGVAVLSLVSPFGAGIGDGPYARGCADAFSRTMTCAASWPLPPSMYVPPGRFLPCSASQGLRGPCFSALDCQARTFAPVSVTDYLAARCRHRGFPPANLLSLSPSLSAAFVVRTGPVGVPPPPRRGSHVHHAVGGPPAPPRSVGGRRHGHTAVCAG